MGKMKLMELGLKITTSQRERFIRRQVYGLGLNIESQNNYLSKREVYQVSVITMCGERPSQNNYLSKREVYVSSVT